MLSVCAIHHIWCCTRHTSQRLHPGWVPHSNMALLRGADELISNNEKEFITTVRCIHAWMSPIVGWGRGAMLTDTLCRPAALQALRSEQRLDGRSPFDYRPVQFQVIMSPFPLPFMP